jgi:hypothetical protein
MNSIEDEINFFSTTCNHSRPTIERHIFLAESDEMNPLLAFFQPFSRMEKLIRKIEFISHRKEEFADA